MFYFWGEYMWGPGNFPGEMDTGPRGMYSMADHLRIRKRLPAAGDHVDVDASPGISVSRKGRSIRTTPPSYRWECPCQEPPVLLATYGPNGRINIKVRDRYWHLFGVGQVQAICPRCAAEHILDLQMLHDALRDGAAEHP